MSMALKQSKANAGANFSSLGTGQFVGDPGLFGFLGKTISRIGGAVLGSTPIGAALGTVTGFLGGRATSPRGATQPIARTPSFFPTAPNFGPQEVVPKPGVRGAIERFLPGGSTGLVVQGGTRMACPSGFHPNKTSYHTQAGFVQAGSKCVKNRRRNPLNPRAASRAISRLESASKATKRITQLTDRKTRTVTKCFRCHQVETKCRCK